MNPENGPNYMQLYNPLTRSKSPTARKILQADMQLSPQCDDCWSSHILSAMDGLTQPCMFKKRLRMCQPIDLSRYVVDLRRHLEYWAPNSDAHPREGSNKCPPYHQCRTLPTKRAVHAFVIHPPKIHVSWSSSGCYPQCGALQTLCPHPTSWNIDL